MATILTASVYQALHTTLSPMHLPVEKMVIDSWHESLKKNKPSFNEFLENRCIWFVQLNFHVSSIIVDFLRMVKDDDSGT